MLQNTYTYNVLKIKLRIPTQQQQDVSSFESGY